MSNSLIYCQQTASDPVRSGLTDRDWSHATERSAEEFADQYIDGLRKLTVTGMLNGEHVEIDETITFDPDAQFDYFATESCICDGTLLFLEACCERLINKVLTCNTYDAHKPEPRDGDCVDWTIGNFVILDEYGKRFATIEKPWLTSRFTVLLPLRMSISHHRRTL